MRFARTPLLLTLLIACKPATAPTSNASETAVEAQQLPIMVAAGESGGSYYLYTAAARDATSVKLCTTGTLEQCQTDASAVAMTPFQLTSGKTIYASRSMALGEGSIVHLVASNGANTAQSRSLRFMKAEGELVLDAPKERQVYQRDTVDKGKIQVQLRSVPPEARYLQARVTGTALSNNAVAPGQWQETELGGSGAQKISINAPAGGWFSVEIVVLDQSKTRLLGRALVKEVGVGEVFLVAGQSNSTNCGRAPQRVDSDFVVSTDGEKWQRGDDPQLGTHDDHLCNNSNGNTHGGSNWPVTGTALAKKYRVPVAFASTGYSGSALAEWLPTVTAPPANDNKNMSLFAYTAKRAEQLSMSGYRAVLWHQGENDAKDNTPRATYEAGMITLIRGLRERTKVETPWLIAVASWCAPNSYGPEWKGASADVTAAQEALVSSRALPELFSGPATDDLDQTYRGHSSAPQDCHFNDRGLKEVGQRWTQKIEALLTAKMP